MAPELAEQSMLELQEAQSVFTENPTRAERWKCLTESVDAEVAATHSQSQYAKNRRRHLLEAMLDMALRTVDVGNNSPVVMDRALTPRLHENLVKNLNEDTTIGWNGATSSIAAATTPNSATPVFTTQNIGLVRRVFPKLIAPEILTTQVMSQPTGKVFYLDIKYNDTATEGNIAAGDRVDDTTAWSFASQRQYADFDTSNAEVSVEGATARELNMSMSETSVVAKSKKLANDLSVEAQMDYRAYHGIDADNELQNATAEEITREIDRDLINFLLTTTISSGAGSVSWAVNGYAGGVPSEQKAWNETLFDALEDASAYIEGKRYKRATWLLTDHLTCARLRKLNSFMTTTSAGSLDQGIEMGGRRMFGTLANRWIVYCDPWFPTTQQIIVGYKGQSMTDVGIAYCPYVPFYRTPPFTNPKTFVQSRGIMSRYGKVSVIPEMYARVALTGS